MDSSDAAPLPPSGRPRRSRAWRPRPAESPVPASPFAPWVHVLLLGGAAAAVAFAGSAAQGSLGVFLVCAGVAMVAFPPRVKVEWRLWLAAAAVAGCAALSLLPEHAIPQPAWRQTLDATPPIIMPGTISVAPAFTVFWFTLLVITLLTGLFALAQPVRSRWLLGLALAAALSAGVYAALAIYARETGWHCALLGPTSEFGFFPNRNHTATFLCTGSLVALGVLGVVLREGRWFIGMLGAGVLAVCVAGLGFYSISRAGIVFLLLGAIVWLAGLGRRHRDQRVVVSFGALLLAGGVLFVVSGGEVRDRLLGRVRRAPAAISSAALPLLDAHTSGGQPDDAAHNLTTEFRVKIYRDALALVQDFPLTGIGLGTFAYVFPQYRQASRAETVVTHPESDWLLFTLEAGIPATLCLLALLTLAGRRIRSERERPYWPLRWGCAVAALAAMLHGMVDVPAHVPPLGWWVLALLGLALQNARTGEAERSRVQHAFFVAGGLAALAMGGSLVRAEWFGGPPTALYAYGDAKYEFFRVVQSDRDRGLQLALQMVRDRPMEEDTYRVLGMTLCLFDHREPQVEAAFHAENLLEPILAVTPLRQGDAWLDADPPHAVKPWLDALARCTRNYRLAGLSQWGLPTAFFANLVQRAAPEPVAQNALWSAVGQGPELAFVWIETANPPQVQEGINRLATNERFLQKLDTVGRHRFLRDWYRRGNRDTLMDFVQARPDWEAASWFLRLRHLADTGQFEQAVRQAAGHEALSLALPEIDPGDALPPSADQEDTDPVAAFLAYWKMGNTRSAERVLDEAVSHAQSPALVQLWRLKIALAVHAADWPAAWRGVEAEVRATHPDESL